MGIFEGKSASERNKIIVAIVIGSMALVSLIYTFGGVFLPAKKSTRTSSEVPTPLPTASNSTELTEVKRLPKQSLIDQQYASIPIIFNGNGASSVPVSGRNIFAFWEPGDPMPAPYQTPRPPTPIPFTPEPTIDYKIFLSFVTPQNVYAGSQQFQISVNGDKFSEKSRIVFNGAPLPTNFVSQQRLTANVPPNLIARAYTGSIEVDEPDGNRFSRRVSFSVQEPPQPTLEYIGMIARQHYNNDTAYFQPKGATTGDPISARLNDVVEGRFRVKSISAEEVEFEDTRLGFKHSLPLLRPKPGTSVSTGTSGYGPGPRPTRGRIPGINGPVRRRTPRVRRTPRPRTTPATVQRVNPTDTKIPINNR